MYTGIEKQCSKHWQSNLGTLRMFISVAQMKIVTNQKIEVLAQL